MAAVELLKIKKRNTKIKLNTKKEIHVPHLTFMYTKSPFLDVLCQHM